ncbi:hypothetical protein [Rhizobium sp. CF122]|uniref:hypothetical protein n=1 Tax=Rhizobium sp. CF122 TaxID=1144312 RepID=UPI00030C8B05|nr:hypothetical protein [Rhizobium sp. CF122]
MAAYQGFITEIGTGTVYSRNVTALYSAAAEQAARAAHHASALRGWASKGTSPVA